MNPPSAKMLVFVGENFACIKIIGRANFNSSIDFKRLVYELRQKGYTYFVLDLSECLLMDSTFLGVLAGLGLNSNGSSAPQQRPIELFKPNARISELLENLGVLHLFTVNLGDLKMPECTQSEHDHIKSSQAELTQACLDAHRTLMALNPENQARFKDVAQFLAEDLKKLRS